MRRLDEHGGVPHAMPRSRWVVTRQDGVVRPENLPGRGCRGGDSHNHCAQLERHQRSLPFGVAREGAKRILTRDTEEVADNRKRPRIRWKTAPDADPLIWHAGNSTPGRLATLHLGALRSEASHRRPEVCLQHVSCTHDTAVSSRRP